MCMSSSPLGQGPPEPSTRKPTFVAAVIAAVESGARKNASARGKVFVRSNSRIEGDDWLTDWGGVVNLFDVFLYVWCICSQILVLKDSRSRCQEMCLMHIIFHFGIRRKFIGPFFLSMPFEWRDASLFFPVLPLTPLNLVTHNASSHPFPHRFSEALTNSDHVFWQRQAWFQMSSWHKPLAKICVKKYPKGSKYSLIDVPTSNGYCGFHCGEWPLLCEVCSPP